MNPDGIRCDPGKDFCDFGNDSVGFGYDSVFIVPDLRCHAAELDVETKQNYSHRGIALRKLTKYLSTNKIDR